MITIPNNLYAQTTGNQTLHSHTLEEIINQANVLNTVSQINVGHSPNSMEILSNKLYIANHDSNTVSVIDATNNTRIKDIPVGKHPHGIAASSDTIYVANSGSNTVSVIDATNNTRIKDISVGEFPNEIVAALGKIYVLNENSNNVSAIDTTNNRKIKDIPVGAGPIDISFEVGTNTVYVANYDSNTVSAIDATNNTRIKDIPVGNNPIGIAFDNQNTGIVYVANSGSKTVSVIDATNNTRIKDISVGADIFNIKTIPSAMYTYGSDGVSVIDGTNNRKIKQIPVGRNPSSVTFNPSSNTLYVVNSGSNTVSVIDTTNNRKIKDIPVGADPNNISFEDATNTVYVANSGSDGISVIDGVTNKVVAAVTFNIHPSNSGQIICNTIDSPINQYLYVSFGTNCIAKPNQGFEFASWIESLGHNSTITLRTSTISDTPLNSFMNAFGITQNDTASTFNVTRFGSFNAYFKAVPPPIPPDYWIPLYGVMVSSIVGWSIPSIIGWIKSKKEGRRVQEYRKRIDSLYDDGKLDDNDISSLDDLKREVIDTHAKGKLADNQYQNLKNQISELYEEIYDKKLRSSNEILDRSNGKILDKVRDEIAYAYVKGKISEAHYNILKEKASQYQNNN